MGCDKISTLLRLEDLRHGYANKYRHNKHSHYRALSLKNKHVILPKQLMLLYTAPLEVPHINLLH